MDERHEIQTRVGSLAVRVRGEGRPAVPWHSLFVDERSWGRVEEGLARDRRLVIITGPGHGESSDPGHRYSMDDCAAAAGESSRPSSGSGRRGARIHTRAGRSS